jgi:hypothetical protein
VFGIIVLNNYFVELPGLELIVFAPLIFLPSLLTQLPQNYIAIDFEVGMNTFFINLPHLTLCFCDSQI